MQIRLFVAFLFLLSACGQPPLPVNKDSVGGKTVSFIIQKVTPFTEFTFESFNKEWFDLTANTNIPIEQRARKRVDASQQAVIAKYDPSDKITARIRQHLIENAGMKEVGNKNSDYTLRFDQVKWGIQHHPIALTTYHIYYKAHVSFDEVKASSTKGPRRNFSSCTFRTDSKYSYDEVFANNAAAVKDAMALAIDVCVQELVKGLN